MPWPINPLSLGQDQIALFLKTTPCYSRVQPGWRKVELKRSVFALFFFFFYDNRSHLSVLLKQGNGHTWIVLVLDGRKLLWLITTLEGLPEAEAEALQRSGAREISVKSTGSS